MSAFGKGTRCDTCGKFSRSRTTGEYTRKDASCGYIWPEENELDHGRPGRDICEECLEKHPDIEARKVDAEVVRTEVRNER